MNDKTAYLGEQMLLDENQKFKLETEYDYDGERIFIQLRNKENDECIVLDADNIFAQAFDIFSEKAGKHDDVMTPFVIRSGCACFKGSPEDVARWYCKRNGIRLYIEPDNDGKENLFVLWASFPDEDTGEHNSNTVTHIAYFENGECDIEAGYRLFFHEYMLEVDNPDYSLAAQS